MYLFCGRSCVRSLLGKPIAPQDLLAVSEEGAHPGEGKGEEKGRRNGRGENVKGGSKKGENTAKINCFTMALVTQSYKQLHYVTSNC